MLTAEDSPTIRHTIMKRLDAERGVDVCEIKIHPHKDHIAVSVLAMIDGDTLVTRSVFHLPLSFELGHLQNEIDQIAEQYKEARVDYWRSGRMLLTEKQASGTGLRGLWVKHG